MPFPVTSLSVPFTSVNLNMCPFKMEGQGFDLESTVIAGMKSSAVFFNPQSKCQLLYWKQMSCAGYSKGNVKQEVFFHGQDAVHCEFMSAKYKINIMYKDIICHL